MAGGLYWQGPRVYALAIQGDDKILIGGWFATVNTSARNNIARLNADGSVDSGFGNGMAGPSSAPLSIATQPDGKVLIGGSFSTVNTTARNFIARLTSDGSIDPAFNPGVLESPTGYGVYCIALQADGKILIGGEFTNVNGIAATRVARLLPSGALDPGFATNSGSHYQRVRALAVQADGKILIAGENRGPTRLNADGSVDSSFSEVILATFGTYTAYYPSVYSMALQSDGKLLMGGYFRLANNIVYGCVARLHGDRPPLAIAPGAASVNLSWPIGWSGFVPQQTTALSLPWADIPQTPVTNATSWAVTIPCTNATQFYRLRR